MSFGTGAVKITPAHDPNDFAVGKRHNLEFLNILTDDGLINDVGGAEFAGKKRFEVRELIVKALEEKGLFRGVAVRPTFRFWLLDHLSLFLAGCPESASEPDLLCFVKLRLSVSTWTLHF